jgi:hypothetical protein
MSKIMRQLMAEARIAREAAANPPTLHVSDTSIKAMPAPASAPTVIDWWISQYQKAGERFKEASSKD